jgi:hypothetical protein
MPDVSLVMTLVFGAAVAAGLRALPGALSWQKVLAVGTGTVITMFVAIVLAAELKRH